MPRLRPDARRVVKVSYKAVDLIASTIGGLLVGLIFNRAWSVIEQEDGAPKPTDEQRSWREILLAAGVDGSSPSLCWPPGHTDSGHTGCAGPAAEAVQMT